MDSNRQAFLISAGFGLFAVFLVYTWVSQKEVSLEKEFGEKVEVLVAARNIGEMEKIARGSVKPVAIPRKFMQPDAIRSSQLKEFFESGDTPVASSPIAEGEQILATKMIWDDGPRSGLATRVNIGMRAIAVPVNDQYGVGKLVKPGDHVDVLAPVNFTEGEVQRIEIKTALQNVLVLATGERISNSVPRILETVPFSGEQRARSLTRDRNYNTVTLEVSPYQAQQVAWLTTQAGVVYLSLRNPADNEVAETLMTTNQEDVLGAASATVRQRRRNSMAPTPPPPAPREPAGAPRPAPRRSF